MKMSNFFFPGIKKLYEYNLFLDEKIESLAFFIKKDEEKDHEKNVKNTKLRVLEEIDEASDDEQEMVGEKMIKIDKSFNLIEKNNLSNILKEEFLLEQVFETPLNAEVKMEEFTVVFQEMDFGLDFYNNGKQS